MCDRTGKVGCPVGYVVIIDDIQQPEPSAIYQAIAHEVHAPALVDRFGYEQRLFDTLWQPSFYSSADIQL